MGRWWGWWGSKRGSVIVSVMGSGGVWMVGCMKGSVMGVCGQDWVLCYYNLK